MSKVKIVLDTNVLLVSIPSRSKYHWIFQKLLSGSFDLLITTEILLEYEEILKRRYSPSVAENVIRALLLLPNVVHQHVYFHWLLIEDDPDDNKFVDAYVAGNADLLVTNDRHFSVLRQVHYPPIHIVSIDMFRSMMHGDGCQ
uniref:Putative toxin-antitoxin system toxin component, PIN family n=1 Tax=Desulfatirhabdium butyrativorans TaxID=340467 RepID=A0A7C4MSH4_9BACT